MNSIGPIIAKYRKLKRYSQPELADLLAKEGIEVTDKAISSWESNRTDPGVKALFTLCKILEIKDIYEEMFGVNPYNPLSRLNDLGKERVVEYVDMLVTNDKYSKGAAEIIPMPIKRTLRLFTARVSAGTGNLLDDGDYNEIEVDEFVPAEADFAITVTGDSMMPLYQDKQVVYVHQQSHLEDGQIGIFGFDGKAYIKKLQSNKKGIALISLNKKYEPIPVLDPNELTIFGRIV